MIDLSVNNSLEGKKIRLHRLESILSSVNEEVQEIKPIVEVHQTPKSSIQSSQPFLAELHKYPTIERYYTEPEHNIIIQGVSDT